MAHIFMLLALRLLSKKTGMTHDLLNTDPLQSAVTAGLRYVLDRGPGIERRRCGRAFRYLGPDRTPIRDRDELKRIRSLAIPPAWTRVWICPSRFGHLQAVGWDARGRKQYRYHPLYREVRDQAKFGRMIAFGTMLSRIRRQVRRDLRRPGLPREKVLAAIIRLLETTFVRVGNDEDARENGSFGLTTLRNRHAEVSGAKVKFHFRGKSGLDQEVELTDPRLAHIVRQCQELPGYELFEYRNGTGEICRVDSADVNCYLREITGQEFSAKDFRTWAGTVLAARELASMGPCHSKAAAKRTIVAAMKAVARQLHNRPATCRKYYVHPAVVEAYEQGSLFERIREGEAQKQAYGRHGLLPEEYAVMVIVAEYQEKQVREARELLRARNYRRSGTRPLRAKLRRGNRRREREEAPHRALQNGFAGIRTVALRNHRKSRPQTLSAR